MNIKIPRGIITNKFLDEMKMLSKSFYANLVNKKVIEKFEKKFSNYNNSKYCVAFPFARTAIYYSIKSLKIPEYSEIIMSPITIKPILDVILDLKLKPIFSDLDPSSLNYNPEDLKKCFSLLNIY